MRGALNVDSPSALLAKLEKEIETLSGDPTDAYAALNAARDAYHLREWIWHHRLDGNPRLQSRVMGKTGGVQDWNAWIHSHFSDFPVLGDLCNGSKHFMLRQPGRIEESHQGGWDKQRWDTLPWDAEGFYLELNNRRVLPVIDLLTKAKDFWKNLFAAHAL